MAKSNLPVRVEIDDVESIDIITQMRGRYVAQVHYWHGGRCKVINIKFDLQDFPCIAREVRRALGERRNELARVISAVEEKV